MPYRYPIKSIKIIDEIKGYHPLDLPQQVGFWNQ